VCEGDGLADAKEDAKAVWNGSDSSDVLVESLAFHELHRVKDAAVGESADVVNGDDPGMFEKGDLAGFAEEAAGEFAFVARNFEDFESDATFQSFVFSGVDDAHAAASDLAKKAIACAGEIREVSTVAEAIQGAIGEIFHRASQPKADLASR